MKPLHIILAVLIVAGWGLNFVAIKIGLQVLSPTLLCFARFFCTSIPIIFFLKRPAVPFKLIVAYGLIMFVLQFLFLFLGMHLGVNAGLASMLIQLQVFFVILLGAIYFQEIPNIWQLLGAVVAFLGIAIIAIYMNGDATLSGFVCIVVAAFTWAIGNLIAKQFGKVSVTSVIAWSSFVAWPPLLTLSLILDGPEKIWYSLHHISWLTTTAIFFLAYPTTLFGFSAWTWLLGKYTVSSITPFTLLVPVFGMLSSAILLHESLQTWKLCAGILIIIGLCLNLVGYRFSIAKNS